MLYEVITRENLPEEAWRRLSECALHLNQLLDLLNAPGEMPTPEETERLAEAIENLEVTQEKALEELRAALKLEE